MLGLLLKQYFNIHCHELVGLNREDSDNGNKLYKVIADEGVFFLKEIPNHSLRDDLDLVFHELDKCNPQKVILVRPLKSSEGRFVVNIDEKMMMLFPFVEHTVLANDKKVDLIALLESLENFFEHTRRVVFPTDPRKNYQGWFARAGSRLEGIVGAHPFLDKFTNYHENRLRELQFECGSVHFDLNPYNVWIDLDGKFLFSDFDNAQVAAYAKDIFDCTSRFLEVNENGVFIKNSDLIKIYSFSKKYVPNLIETDVNFLLVRPKLGELFDPNSKYTREDVVKRLNFLNEFLS